MADFNLWAGACSHVDTDVDPMASMHEHDNPEPRESLADPIRQSEGHVDGAPGFDWNVMLHLGDLCKGEPEPPGDEAGREVHRQWSALRTHHREQIYTVIGNHDASGLEDSDTGNPPQWWFREWIDPLGTHPERSGVDPDARPFPLDGTWERYSFEAGNILFLLMVIVMISHHRSARPTTTRTAAFLLVPLQRRRSNGGGRWSKRTKTRSS